MIIASIVWFLVLTTVLLAMSYHDQESYTLSCKAKDFASTQTMIQYQVVEDVSCEDIPTSWSL